MNEDKSLSYDVCQYTLKQNNFRIHFFFGGGGVGKIMHQKSTRTAFHRDVIKCET